MWSLNSFQEVLNRLRMYENGYSMAMVLDHRSTATSLTGNLCGNPLSMVRDTNTLLHWCFGIRSDIARPVGSAISPRIPKHLCNNGFIFIP